MYKMIGVFKIIRGDTYNEDITFTDNWVPVNLTGHTVYFTVKETKDLSKNDDSDAVIQKKITSHINPTGWITVLQLLVSDTSDLDPSKSYSYDLQLVSPSGSVLSTETASFVVSQDTTTSYAL